MHKLLQRQVKSHLGGEDLDAFPEAWKRLLASVNEAYEQVDADRLLLERSLELTSQELIQRNKELRRQAEELARSNADLEQFAYVASHDLQEPLRMVGIYTQLFTRRYHHLDADAEECIGYVLEGVQRMQLLIEDLLAYSRVGTRGQAFAPTDCQATVSRVLANLQAAIQEAGGVVTFDPLPTVMSDVVQLTQVFQNLIGNAIKFHRKDEPPRVHLSVVRKGAEWVFAVRDNGIGIDPKYADRIFVIFQRLHTRAEYPGTGIGLAICKKIVERHGGRMWLDSRPGDGTTFYFTIPAGMSAPPAERSRAEQAGQQRGGAA